ncbi:MAG: hypothetical protein HFI35_14145 [Roseburia sp.]|jgi:hypothetical protein|nr:hypothetical protein [Roseburia sp.]
MIIPAIVIVTYNRPRSLQRLLQSLSCACYEGYTGISLVISIDKSDIQEEIIDIVEKFKWEYGDKIIRKYDVRQGLKKHVLQCGDLTDQYDAVIILEDDLFVSTDFYNYTVQALNYYQNEERVAGIGLYSHEWNGYAFCPFQKRIGDSDVFAGQFSITWGQCWHKKAWKKFRTWMENHQEINIIENAPRRISRWSEQSWGKYFVSYIVENNLYYIIPIFSMTTNFSEVGEHNNSINTDHQVMLWECKEKVYHFKPIEALIKYDIFFEPILDTVSLFGLSQDSVLIDLNATPNRQYHRRYILTTKNLNYALKKKYGLQLRPIENNVIHNVPGTGIYLYDTKIKCRNRLKKSKYRYDLRGFTFLEMLPASIQNMKEVFRAKMHL